MRTEIVNTLLEARITAIVRGIAPEKLRRTADALCEGGVRTIEVTFDTPGAADMIRLLKKEYADRMLVGAGTVLDTETCRTAILAGADFVLAPTLNTEVIKMCNRYGRAAVPGVMTPTEILTALEAGADIVKVFPAGALGPGYVKDVMGPLKQATIMVVGGVSLENIADFFRAGAACAGIASNLVSKSLVDADDYAAIAERAAAFVQAAKRLIHTPQTEKTKRG